MRRILVWVVIVSAALILDPVAQACGFKLLPLGRGIRYQSRHTPRAGSVLLYLPTTGSGRSLTDPNIESALREAGHAVRAVTTKGDLENALRGGVYDVILANEPHSLHKRNTARAIRRRYCVCAMVKRRFWLA